MWWNEYKKANGKTDVKFLFNILENSFLLLLKRCIKKIVIILIDIMSKYTVVLKLPNVSHISNTDIIQNINSKDKQYCLSIIELFKKIKKLNR